MKALRLIEERNLRILDVPEPPPPGPGEVRLRMRAIALNHIDVWGYRGMAFAQRNLPITVGAEGVGEIEAVGAGVTLKPGTLVSLYGGRTCGTCRRCVEGRDNLCENIAGIMGFHIDGMAQQWLNTPARLVVPVPEGVGVTHAACAGITFSTVEHMLVDNAKLERGETILIHAAGSGIGSTAILYAGDLGCEIFTTASTDAKLEKARALGAHHLINYKEQRFETIVRRKTNKRGVDVVFEHIGPDTWAGSLFALARGGRLVTCGSTSGITAETNLFSVFQQQLHIFGSFGSPIRSIAGGLAKMARGILPVIDSEYPIEDFGTGLTRLASRDVFGKIVIHLP
jgi:NADPH:quinone reductase-like Zn-dependent oxidoreductase